MVNLFDIAVAKKLSGGGGGGGGNGYYTATLTEGGTIDVSFSDTATTILQTLFQWNNKLNKAIISDSVSTIGQQAFANSSIKEIDIGNGVQTIGDSVFNSCSNMTKFTIRAITPPTCAKYSLTGLPNACPIYVPAVSVEAYKAAQYWSARASYIQAIS